MKKKTQVIAVSFALSSSDVEKWVRHPPPAGSRNSVSQRPRLIEVKPSSLPPPASVSTPSNASSSTTKKQLVTETQLKARFNAGVKQGARDMASAVQGVLNLQGAVARYLLHQFRLNVQRILLDFIFISCRASSTGGKYEQSAKISRQLASVVARPAGVPIPSLPSSRQGMHHEEL